MPQYKFVEVSPVTDETLEAAVNEWVAKGWQLEDIRFVPEISKRPQLAFVVFLTPSGPGAPPRPEDPSGRPVQVITAGDEVE
jgi:hypothetical protein